MYEPKKKLEDLNVQLPGESSLRTNFKHLFTRNWLQQRKMFHNICRFK
jgi:hypothetical protein